MGDAPRTVACWVRRFEEEALAGLVEGERPGRPRRLNQEQVRQIDRALRKTPREFGLIGNVWDGKTLAAFIYEQWDVTLGLVLGLLWPMALFSALGGSPGEFFEALFDDDEALAAWGVALARISCEKSGLGARATRFSTLVL